MRHKQEPHFLHGTAEYTRNIRKMAGIIAGMADGREEVIIYPAASGAVPVGEDIKEYLEMVGKRSRIYPFHVDSTSGAVVYPERDALLMVLPESNVLHFELDDTSTSGRTLLAFYRQLRRMGIEPKDIKMGALFDRAGYTDICVSACYRKRMSRDDAEILPGEQDAIYLPATSFKTPSELDIYYATYFPGYVPRHAKNGKRMTVPDGALRVMFTQD